MTKKLDINCDMGESFYDLKIGNDTQIMPYITSCNIACGFHGGDPKTISDTVKLALKYDVKIGAHPSFYDIKGFGRRKLNLSDDELESALIYQISSVKGIAEYLGAELNHVKPHGAMYNMASNDDNIAEVIVKSIKKIDPKIKLYGPSMMNWKKISLKHGVEYISEVFSDRNYNDDFTLVDRGNNNSMITNVNDSLKHISMMVDEGKVKTINGKYLDIEVDTICIHGDQKNAFLFAKSIFKYFESKIRV